MAQQALNLVDFASPQCTPVRAELVALHAALHSPSLPIDQARTQVSRASNWLQPMASW